jgi:hypothetical protein
MQAHAPDVWCCCWITKNSVAPLLQLTLIVVVCNHLLGDVDLEFSVFSSFKHRALTVSRLFRMGGRGSKRNTWCFGVSKEEREKGATITIQCEIRHRERDDHVP